RKGLLSSPTLQVALAQVGIYDPRERVRQCTTMHGEPFMDITGPVPIQRGGGKLIHDVCSSHVRKHMTTRVLLVIAIYHFPKTLSGVIRPVKKITYLIPIVYGVQHHLECARSIILNGLA